MSAVSSSAHLGGLVAVNVGDVDLVQLQLVNFGVGLDVAQQVQEGLGGLLRPTDLVARSLVLFANGVSADSAGVLGERDGLLVQQNVLKVRLGLAQLQSLDGVANLTAVLEVDSQVSTSRLGSCSCQEYDRSEFSVKRNQIIQLPLVLLSTTLLN